MNSEDNGSSTLVVGEPGGPVGRSIARIREIHQRLQMETDLSPANPAVTEMIERLVQLLRTPCSPEEERDVLGSAYIRRHRRDLQNRLSEAEFLAELDDARRIGQAGRCALELVARLPVWKVYSALVGEELACVRRLTQPGRRIGGKPIVFVGSGPLPLSAIMLHRFGGIDVVCVELDPRAYEASCVVLERAGLSGSVTVHLADGAAFDYGAYNGSLVFVASLVRSKLDVLDRISRTAPDCLAAVRTAEGMKQLMYEAVDKSQLLGRGWRLLTHTRPDARLVVNSTLFLERSAAR